MPEQTEDEVVLEICVQMNAKRCRPARDLVLPCDFNTGPNGIYALAERPGSDATFLVLRLNGEMVELPRPPPQFVDTVQAYQLELNFSDKRAIVKSAWNLQGTPCFTLFPEHLLRPYWPCAHEDTKVRRQLCLTDVEVAAADAGAGSPKRKLMLADGVEALPSPLPETTTLPAQAGSSCSAPPPHPPPLPPPHRSPTPPLPVDELDYAPPGPMS